MRIVGVLAPGASISVDAVLAHGEDPRMMLWRHGFLMTHPLSTHLDDQGIVLTTQVRPRANNSRPPRVKSRGLDPSLTIAQDEKPVPHQRVAAYAIVRSQRGVLGTQCSDRTAIPGLWQLPGGGLEQGETPSEGVMREIMEESSQRVRISRLIDVQSDHWIGRSPSGVLEDFQALRIIYTAVCADPTDPLVLDVGGTTMAASWVPVPRWRSLPWTSGARSLLDRHLNHIRLR
ncbi:MAG: NUDIX domain-containing protein [Propionibacteriaceae bacterium]|nr:NUDIX domain-containing protein [Propionibacteriaceae bacterium]NLI85205.1 NUDIX domain-containing protein [Propionibacterium sp.]